MKDETTSHLETLSEIKQLMERSSRFISLSGLSGVFAGVYALLGAYAAYYVLKSNLVDVFGAGRYTIGGNSLPANLLNFLFLDAAVVLLLAVTTGIFLTTRKASKDGNSIFDATAKKLVLNLCIPLVVGGFFCLALVYHGIIFHVAPAMLIFYGLALINASKYTRSDIRSLGIAEVLLGLLASYKIGYGLICWAIGFGILHIIYGIYMYYKYER